MWCEMFNILLTPDKYVMQYVVPTVQFVVYMEQCEVCGVLLSGCSVQCDIFKMLCS